MAIQAGNLKGSLKTPGEEQRMPASAEIEHSAAFTDDEDGSSAMIQSDLEGDVTKHRPRVQKMPFVNRNLESVTQAEFERSSF